MQHDSESLDGAALQGGEWGHSPPPMRLTRRGRNALGMAILLLVLVGVLGSWQLRATADEPPQRVVVASGDTISGLLLEHGGDASPERIAEFQQLNGVDGGQLAEGQEVRLP